MEYIPQNFFKRLKSFVENVQVNDMPSEEEKEMILYVCDRNLIDSVCKDFLHTESKD